MGFSDGFGFGGASFAQVDGGSDNDCDGEEFALPVLEGFEPELRGSDVFKDGDRWLAVGGLFFAVGVGAADGVQDDGRREQQEEQTGQ